MPQTVIENELFEILWDFTVETDHVIEARRPDMIVVDKMNNKSTIIDFAIPYDSRIEDKEREKIEKYQDIARELKIVWDMPVNVIPIVIGALGSTPKRLNSW